ncbi:Solute carrier family 22 member 7 [Bienertia sinuspersici]
MPSPMHIVNFCCFPRSFLPFSHHILAKFHHSVPPHRCKVVNLKNEDCDDFLPWLENKAGVSISSSLSIGNSDYGRGKLVEIEKNRS